MLNSSVLRRLQKQNADDGDEDKSWTAAGREFQAAGPQTAKLRDLYRDSRERAGIIRSPRVARETNVDRRECTDVSDKTVIQCTSAVTSQMVVQKCRAQSAPYFRMAVSRRL